MERFICNQIVFPINCHPSVLANAIFCSFRPEELWHGEKCQSGTNLYLLYSHAFQESHAHDHSLVIGTSDARHDQRHAPSRCIIVREGEVIATGSNMTNETRNVSAQFYSNLKPFLRMADS